MLIINEKHSNSTALKHIHNILLQKGSETFKFSHTSKNLYLVHSNENCILPSKNVNYKISRFPVGKQSQFLCGGSDTLELQLQTLSFFTWVFLKSSPNLHKNTSFD